MFPIHRGGVLSGPHHIVLSLIFVCLFLPPSISTLCLSLILLCVSLSGEDDREWLPQDIAFYINISTPLRDISLAIFNQDMRDRWTKGLSDCQAKMIVPDPGPQKVRNTGLGLRVWCACVCWCVCGIVYVRECACACVIVVHRRQKEADFYGN